MAHYLEKEENEYFTYFKEFKENGRRYEIYDDDYGQCFVIAWRDVETGDIDQWSCGAYNDYVLDLESIIESQNRKLRRKQWREWNQNYEDT